MTTRPDYKIVPGQRACYLRVGNQVVLTCTERPGLPDYWTVAHTLRGSVAATITAITLGRCDRRRTYTFTCRTFDGRTITTRPFYGINALPAPYPRRSK